MEIVLDGQALDTRVVGVWGQGGKGGVMIIGDTVGAEDEIKGVPFSGKKDNIVLSVLQRGLSVDTRTMYFTNLIKKKYPEGRKPTVPEAMTWLPALLAEIEDVAPKVIVTLGELAFNVVCGETGIVNKRGELHKVTFGLSSGERTISVIPTVSGAYLGYNMGLLTNFAQDLERAVLIGAGANIEHIRTRVHYMDKPEEVETLIAYVKLTGICCFDFETNAKPQYSKEFRPTLLSVSFQHGSSWVIPLEHKDSPISKKKTFWILERLNAEIFQNPDVEKVAHNFKYDAHCLVYYGITRIRGRWSDTMVMHHLLDENEKNGLKFIVSTTFPEFTGYDSEVKKYTKPDSDKVDWDNVPLPVLVPYAGTDSDLALRLKTCYEAELLEDPRLYRVYRNLQMAAIKTLFEAERLGLQVDVEFLEVAIRETEEIAKKQEAILLEHKVVRRYEQHARAEAKKAEIAECEAKLTKWVGKHVKEGLAYEVKLRARIAGLKTGTIDVYAGLNVGSWQQLSKLLYGPVGFKFPLPYVRQKRDYYPSTNKDVLEQMKDTTGFVDSLLLYRTIQKMLGTYMKGVYKKLDRKNRVHTSFKQTGTVTGRLSSAAPNLQNVPRAAKLKSTLAVSIVDKIKTMFTAPAGYYLLQVDYSQAELRLVAEFSRDEVMIDAYARGLDLHLVTALNVNSLTQAQFDAMPPKDSKELRARAKPANFGLVYDISVDGFIDYARKTYGIILTKPEAEAIYSGYFRLYKRLKMWHKTSIQSAEKNGYVRTLFGRKRRLIEIHNPDPYLKAFDDRAAINAPVQGTGGEFTIFAMALLRERLDPSIKIVLNVHDSILFYVPYDLLDSAVPLIVDTCENLPTEQYFRAALKYVTMKVDAEVTKTNWKELKPYEAPENKT